MMVATLTKDEVALRSPQQRGKGSIANRYLEAIRLQCGGDLDSNAGTNTYRPTPIAKTHNDSLSDKNSRKNK